MKAAFLFLAGCLLAAGASAAPRVFAPVFLKPGALNEAYVWDEAPVGPFTVEIRRPDSAKPLAEAKGFAVDRPLSALGVGNRPLKWAAAFLAPDALEAPGPVTLRFLGADGSLWGEAASEIKPRTFPSEALLLDETLSELRSKPNKRKDREAAEIWKLYLAFDSKTKWPEGRFRLPVAPSSRTSAHFGDVRNYRYADGTSSNDYHRGTDFAIPSGTVVTAPAAGTVALVADRMLTGLTIVLGHGPGLYSVYFHLSQTLIKKGQRVGAGDRIGLSGATGLATGPHLHWEVRYGGVSVDALDLVTDGLLDTNTVSTIISSVERPIH